MNKATVTRLPVEPRIISRAEHTLSRANVSEYALKVLYRLKNAGYKAYLVGGSVRDLLLGREPKDFDIGKGFRAWFQFSHYALCPMRYALTI